MGSCLRLASFFVTLAYAPYPLGLPAVGIGLVMTGFGVGLALMSVAVAPRLTHRFSPLRTLWISLVVFALTMAATAVSTGNQPVLILCTILLGFEIGLLNTVLTEAVMESSDLPRPVASSAYSGVRFLGGAIGAPVGTSLADHGDGFPFLLAGTTALIGAVIVVTCRRVIARADEPRRSPSQTTECLGPFRRGSTGGSGYIARGGRGSEGRRRPGVRRWNRGQRSSRKDAPDRAVARAEASSAGPGRP